MGKGLNDGQGNLENEIDYCMFNESKEIIRHCTEKLV